MQEGKKISIIRRSNISNGNNEKLEESNHENNEYLLSNKYHTEQNPQISFSAIESSIQHQSQKSAQISQDLLIFIRPGTNSRQDNSSNEDSKSQSRNFDLYSETLEDQNKINQFSFSKNKVSQTQLFLMIISKRKIKAIYLSPINTTNGKFNKFCDQQILKDNLEYFYYYHSFNFSKLEAAEQYQLQITFNQQKVQQKPYIISEVKNKTIKIICIDQNLNEEKDLSSLKAWNSFNVIFSNLIKRQWDSSQNLHQWICIFQKAYKHIKFLDPKQLTEFIKFPKAYSKQYLQLLILVLCKITEKPYLYMSVLEGKDNLINILPKVSQFNSSIGQIDGFQSQYPQKQYLNAIYSIVLLLLKQQIQIQNSLANYYFIDVLKFQMPLVQHQILKQLFSNSKIQQFYHTLDFDNFFELLQKAYQLQVNLYNNLLSQYLGNKCQQSCNLHNLLSIVSLHGESNPLPKNFLQILQVKKKQIYFTNQICSYQLAVEVKKYEKNSFSYNFLSSLIREQSITFKVDRSSKNNFHISYHLKGYQIYQYQNKYSEDDIQKILIQKWQRFPKHYIQLDDKSEQILAHFRKILSPFDFEAAQHFLKTLKQCFQTSQFSESEKQNILSQMNEIYEKQSTKNHKNVLSINSQLAILSSKLGKKSQS